VTWSGIESVPQPRNISIAQGHGIIYNLLSGRAGRAEQVDRLLEAIGSIALAI